MLSLTTHAIRKMSSAHTSTTQIVVAGHVFKHKVKTSSSELSTKCEFAALANLCGINHLIIIFLPSVVEIARAKN